MRAHTVASKNRGLGSVFESEHPASQTIERVVKLTTNVDRRFPKGCLYVKAKGAQLDLREGSRALVKRIREKNLAIYEEWSARAPLVPPMTPKLAGQYIDAQLEIALALIGRGTLALQALVPD